MTSSTALIEMKDFNEMLVHFHQNWNNSTHINGINEIHCLHIWEIERYMHYTSYFLKAISSSLEVEKSIHNVRPVRLSVCHSVRADISSPLGYEMTRVRPMWPAVTKEQFVTSCDQLWPVSLVVAGPAGNEGAKRPSGGWQISCHQLWPDGERSDPFIASEASLAGRNALRRVKRRGARSNS